MCGRSSAVVQAHAKCGTYVGIGIICTGGGGAGSGIGMGMTGSADGSPVVYWLGDDRYRPPAPLMIGDRVSWSISERVRSLPTTDDLWLSVGAVPYPTVDSDGLRAEPTADPATDGGRGTRAARLECEPRLEFAAERGVGGTGYATPLGLGAAAYDGVDRPESLRVRTGGVVSESDEPRLDDTTESVSSSRRETLERE